MRFLLFLFIVLSLVGVSETIYAQSETKCADIQKYKIFQVLNNGALAYACEEQYGRELCYGMVVFLPTKKDEDYYDDKIIAAPKGQCIAYDGVYKYVTSSGNNKTVPMLIFIQK